MIHRPVLYHQLVDNTDGLINNLINNWLIRKNPYQQSIADKELIFDKVVHINTVRYIISCLIRKSADN